MEKYLSNILHKVYVILMGENNKLETNKKKSIIEMISEKREKKIEEEVKRNEFLNQLNEWKMRGYDVERLEEIMNSDIKYIEKEFINFTNGIVEGKIISKIEMDRLKLQRVQEINKLQKQRKDIDLEASIFIRSVYSKMRDFKPEYSPLGYYLGDENWNIDLSQDSFSLVGKVGRLFRELFKIQSDYIKTPDSLQNEIIGIQDIALEKKNKNQFFIKCCVVDKIDNLSQGNYFINFIDRVISIYLYDLSENTLCYNSNDWKTEIFSEWFKKDGNPLSLREIIKKIEDKNGIFLQDGMVSHLNFDAQRARKLLKKLETDGKIISISESKGEYSYVN